MNSGKTFFCVLLAVLLLLTACSAPAADRTAASASDNYLFRKTSYDGFWYKINPVTGSASAVCCDPLCGHTGTSECPLWTDPAATVDDYCAVGDCFYIFNVDAIYEYGIVSGVKTRIFESDGTLLFAGRCGELIYFFELLVQLKEGTSEYLSLFKLYRYDSADGGATLLADSDDYGFMSKSGDSSHGIAYGAPIRFLYADGDTVYWNVGYGGMTTDLDFRNAKQTEMFNTWDDVVLHDGYAYYTVHAEDITTMEKTNYTVRHLYASQNLMRRELSGGKSEMIAQNVGGFIILGDSIYFAECQPDATWHNGDKKLWYDWFEGRIYRCDPDGDNKRLAASMPEYNFYCYPDKYVFLGGKHSEDADCAALYFYDTVYTGSIDNNGYEYTLSPDTLVVNLTTGEYTRVSAPD